MFLRGIECILSRAGGTPLGIIFTPESPPRQQILEQAEEARRWLKSLVDTLSEEAHPDTEIDPYSRPLMGSRLAHGEKKVSL